MSLNLDEQEFINKYGFSLNDLYYSCIENICKVGYVSCSVKELAYQIKNEIYMELGENNVDSNILYKQTKEKHFNIEIYIHNIAIPYKDIYFTFEIGWTNTSLAVMDWDLKSEEEINKDKKYNDIEEALIDEEENEQ